MLSNPESRKEKRWAVMVKPSAIMINRDAKLPVINPTTWNIVTDIEAVASGATSVTLYGNYTATAKLNYPYRFYTSVNTDEPEVIQFTNIIYNSNTRLTTFTLASAVTRSYEKGSRIVGGSYVSTISVDASCGDQTIELTDDLGLTSGNYLAIDNGTSQAEVVYISSLTGTTATLATPLYFDHSALAPIVLLDSDKYLNSSQDLMYRINFDTIFGRLPALSGTSNSYARVGGGSSKPWVQVGEPCSFAKAKALAVVQAQEAGLANIKIVRVIDTYDVLYPIS